MDLVEAPAQARPAAQAPRPSGSGPVDPANLLALYLRDISAVPLLTAADEVRLAREIEVGVLAAERLAFADDLSSGSATDLTADDRADLDTLVATGQRATSLLIRANLRLVVSLAKRYQNSGTAMLDLVQEGNIGLMRAVQKFDHRRGFKFSTYATWWIRQAIARGYGGQNRTIRVPVHVVEAIHRVSAQQRILTQELGRKPTLAELAMASDLTVTRVVELVKLADPPVSLDLRVGESGQGLLGDLIADGESSGCGPVDEFSRRAVRREVEQLLRTVTPREQRVLRMRFGLSDDRIHTLEEVGTELGISRERVRQLEVRALARIRQAHSLDGFREYLHA